MMQTRCNNAINIIKYLCGTWWGSDPETLTILYKSFVRSVMDYGIFLYLPKNKKYSKRMEQIQYTAIRAALGYRRSTPTNLLLAKSKLPLIQERAKFLGNKYICKVLSNKSSLMYNNLQYVMESTKKRKRILKQCIENRITLADSIETQDNYNIFLHDYRTIITSISVNISLGQKLKKERNPNLAFKTFLENQHALDIYTDGSKILGNNHVGSA